MTAIPTETRTHVGCKSGEALTSEATADAHGWLHLMITHSHTLCTAPSASWLAASCPKLAAELSEIAPAPRPTSTIGAYGVECAVDPGAEHGAEETRDALNPTRRR